jgi:signal transduction histidine kinase
VITGGKVVLTNDAASDPRSGGIPPGHPPLHNFLGVPILRETEVVGMIGVANRPGGYTGAEQAGIEILSQAAGVLYDNYQRQIREAGLENKRREAEEELKNSREQLRNLSTRLQSMLEEERTRISREIHDELGQMLTALKMELSWLKNQLTEDQTSLRERASSMLKLVDTTLSTMRKISTELRPGILDDLGLIAAIEWQAHEFQNRTGIQCKIHVSPENIALDPVRTTTIFRIFQEALTNAARHSNADKINVRLKKKGNNLILEVKDNGRGIRENEIFHSKSLGLLGIRERVYLWGGKVKIHGIQGKGTTLAVQIPLPASPDASKAEETS